VFFPEDAHFLAVTVVGEGESNVAAGTEKVLSHLKENLGVLQRNFGHKLAGREVTPAFDFKKVPARKNQRSWGFNSLGKGLRVHCGSCLMPCCCGKLCERELYWSRRRGFWREAW